MENNVFEQMVKRYDIEERMALAKVIVEKVRPVLQETQSKSLLDYGGGTGLVSLELGDEVDSILLVDSSKQMVEVVKAKIAHKGMTNFRVLHADFTQETPELKADIILMSLVLLHIPNTRMILQKLFNMLNKDGQLIIVDFDKDVGFTSIDMQTFYYGSRIFMNQDASMFMASSIK